MILIFFFDRIILKIAPIAQLGRAYIAPRASVYCARGERILRPGRAYSARGERILRPGRAYIFDQNTFYLWKRQYTVCIWTCTTGTIYR